MGRSGGGGVRAVRAVRGGGYRSRSENVIHQSVGIFDPFSNKLLFLLSVKR
jgi:hypothetical protein